MTQATTAAGWPASARWFTDHDLSVGGVGLAGLAAQYGTPCYVLDLGEFRARCAAYREAFPDAEVAYAGKALLTRAVVRLVEAAGLGLDVCSAGELALALAAGFPAERVIGHGNAKSHEFLLAAARAGVGRLVIDSLDEIDALADVIPFGVHQRVLLRLTPDVDAGTHPAITTATPGQKFGLSITSGAAAEGVHRVLNTPALRLVGVHTHLGSQLTDPAPYGEAARRMISFLAAVQVEHGITLPELNLGGGHGIAYRPGDRELAPAEVADVIHRALAAATREHRLPMPQLTIEPGRAIAGPSGVTIYRVLVVKRDRGRTWVAVDGGMSDNPRPALYGARYAPRLFGRVATSDTAPATVVGRNCESGDIVAEDVELPIDVHAGDLVAVPATGAYHHSMASTYNLTPRPPVVGVADGHARLLVRRETITDLLARDLD